LKQVAKMVVDHAGGLHVGVADRAADEPEAALFQGLAHCVRFRCDGRHLARLAPSVRFGAAADKLPDVVVEAAELALYCEKRFALEIADSILRRFLTMPGSRSSDATRRRSKAATLRGSNSRKPRDSAPAS
jgi:hypothetical protein